MHYNGLQLNEVKLIIYERGYKLYPIIQNNMKKREILEKHWKQFRFSAGLNYEPMSDNAYEQMENAMNEYAEFRLGDVTDLLFAWQKHVNNLNGDKLGNPDNVEIKKFLANYYR